MLTRRALVIGGVSGTISATFIPYARAKSNVDFISTGIDFKEPAGSTKSENNSGKSKREHSAVAKDQPPTRYNSQVVERDNKEKVRAKKAVGEGAKFLDEFAPKAGGVLFAAVKAEWSVGSQIGKQSQKMMERYSDFVGLTELGIRLGNAFSEPNKENVGELTSSGLQLGLESLLISTSKGFTDTPISFRGRSISPEGVSVGTGMAASLIAAAIIDQNKELIIERVVPRVRQIYNHFKSDPVGAWGGFKEGMSGVERDLEVRALLWLIRSERIGTH